MIIGNFLPMFWEDLAANTFTIVKEYGVDGRMCCLIEGKGGLGDSTSQPLGDAVLWGFHSCLLGPLEARKGDGAVRGRYTNDRLNRLRGRTKWRW